MMRIKPLIYLVFALFVVVACSSGAEDSHDDLRTEDIAPDMALADNRADLAMDDVAGPDDLAAPETFVDAAEEVAGADVPVDAPELPALDIEVATPDSWQRGPVVIPWSVGDDVAQLLDLRFEVSVDGGPYQSALALTGYGDALNAVGPGDYRFVWDSMANVTSDSQLVVVRLTASVDGTDVGSALTDPMTVRNNPESVRTVLVTSSINGNDKVRPVTFDHNDGLAFDGTVLSVAAGPVGAAFSPNGKAAVTFSPGEGAATFLTIDQDGTVAVAQTLDIGTLYVEKGLYDEDGASIYLMDGNSTPEAGIYRLAVDPWTGLPQDGAAPVFLSHHHVAKDIALMPFNEGYAVVAGTKVGEIMAMVTTCLPDGTETAAAPFGPDGSSATAVAVSPIGDTVAVAYYNLYGSADQVITFLRHGDGTLEELGVVDVVDPDDMVFGTDGMSIVVSSAAGNKVRLLRIGGGVALSDLHSLKLDLATSIGRPIWGLDANRFFIASVSFSTGESALGQVALSGDELVLEDTLSFGNGNDVIPHAVTMQP